MRRLLYFSLLLASLAACVGQVPEPTTQHVARAQSRWPGTTQARLTEGRELFVERCSGCHSLPIPAEHKAAEWPDVMKRMKPFVRMTPEQLTSVERYLIVASEVANGAPSQARN
ncbi:MAG: hypothetical protein KC766_24190 [Myxococcales bacterium]|nr:hypothetical protein [Myxococcales bacterium]